MIIKHKDLLHDISNLAYVIADVCEGRESPHSLHQIYDICEEGNIDRVNSLLTLAAAEVAAALSPIGSISRRKELYRLKFKGISKEYAFKITELIREYMVTSVLHGWLAITLPSGASFWNDRKLNLMDTLDTSIFMAVASNNATLTRRLSPF